MVSWAGVFTDSVVRGLAAVAVPGRRGPCGGPVLSGLSKREALKNIGRRHAIDAT